jgi:gluconolactonase
MQAEQFTDLKVLATGLRFPEGPVALADGSIALVEIEGGR